MKTSPRRIVVRHLGLLGLCAVTLHAADYYCDPVNGSMSNPGTSGSPWSKLEDVFAAGKTFASGDVIYLRNGHHGHPVISNANSGTVTIRPQPGHNPTLKHVTFDSPAKNWGLSGLTISPETSGTPPTTALVFIDAGCSNITVEDCFLYCASDTSGWTANDWNTKTRSAVATYGAYTTVRRTVMRNVANGIASMPEAHHSLFSQNLIENFCKDGIIGLSDDTVYEYNVVRNSYNLGDSMHRDGFQSYSYQNKTKPYGQPGWGIVSNVTLRGNAFISQTDPNQPFSTEDGHNMHGIGCFDGMYQNWVVENNLVANGNSMGITFLGAWDCRIVNNTVVINPFKSWKQPGEMPKIEVSAHKQGGPYSNVPSQNNLIRNNIAWDRKYWNSYNFVSDHNIWVAQLNNNFASGYFVNFAGFDFRPLGGGPLIDAGSPSLAPSIDIAGNPRPYGATHDIGAYEYALIFADNFESYPSGANIGGQPVGSTTWTANGTQPPGRTATISTAQSYGGGSKSLYLVQAQSGDRPRVSLNLINGGFLSSALNKGTFTFAVREDPNNPSGENSFTVNLGNMALSRYKDSSGSNRFYFNISGGTGATLSFSGSNYTYTAGQWNVMKISFDNTAKTATLTINGGQAATITGASANFSVSGFTLGLYSSSINNGKVFFDSVEVSP
jgi:hypothetical protein